MSRIKHTKMIKIGFNHNQFDKLPNDKNQPREIV